MSTKNPTTSPPNMSSMTSPLTTQTTTPRPYWLPWESWVCEKQGTSCYQRRLRNCSTGTDNDCIQSLGGIQYNVGLCTETTCPGYCYLFVLLLWCTITINLEKFLTTTFTKFHAAKFISFLQEISWFIFWNFHLWKLDFVVIVVVEETGSF